MSTLSNGEIAAAYADLRARCIEVGRSITTDKAAAPTQCCPAWSVKDTLAHLSGINADIVSGNTEGAGTEPWADAQVEARRGHSLEEVCAEWEANAPAIDELLTAMGAKMPALLYLDAWTHEWDIRQATGVGAKPDMRLLDHAWITLIGQIEEQNGGPLEVELDRFELARLSMGRRSRAQVEALGLRPDGVVLWTPNELDIVDAPQL